MLLILDFQLVTEILGYQKIQIMHLELPKVFVVTFEAHKTFLTDLL